MPWGGTFFFPWMEKEATDRRELMSAVDFQWCS